MKTVRSMSPKARPITFDPFNNKYVVLGDTVGTAFRDGKALK